RPNPVCVVAGSGAAGVGFGPARGPPGTGVRLGAGCDGERVAAAATVDPHPATTPRSRKATIRRRFAVIGSSSLRALEPVGHEETAVAPQHDGGPWPPDPLTRSAAGRHSV